MKGEVIESVDPEIRSKININSETLCWEWQGARSPGPNGYGCFRRRPESTIYAHRYMFERFRGPIPKGIHVCHRCDNKRCCNPNHLFLGTMKDNLRDASIKGMLDRGFKTACRRGHDLTNDENYISDKKKGCSFCRREYHRTHQRIRRWIKSMSTGHSILYDHNGNVIASPELRKKAEELLRVFVANNSSMFQDWVRQHGLLRPPVFFDTRRGEWFWSER